MSHLAATVAATSKDLGTKLGFLLGNTGVLAINAVIASDLGDTVSAQAGGSRLFKLLFLYNLHGLTSPSERLIIITVLSLLFSEHFLIFLVKL